MIKAKGKARAKDEEEDDEDGYLPEDVGPSGVRNGTSGAGGGGGRNGYEEDNISPEVRALMAK